MASIRYYLDTKKSDLLKLNVYDNEYLDQELERIITENEFGNVPQENYEQLKFTTKVAIDKSDLQYKKDTQADKLFNLKKRFKDRASDITQMMKQKQSMSRGDMIGKLDRLGYRFGPAVD